MPMMSAICPSSAAESASHCQGRRNELPHAYINMISDISRLPASFTTPRTRL